MHLQTKLEKTIKAQVNIKLTQVNIAILIIHHMSKFMPVLVKSMTMTPAQMMEIVGNTTTKHKLHAMKLRKPFTSSKARPPTTSTKEKQSRLYAMICMKMSAL